MKLKLDITPVNDWLGESKGPLLIAGPCSAESEEQVLQTAKQLAAQGLTKIFRAGVWKPRTRPDSFEGLGSKALPWLKRVKEETGLLTAVEVANGNHVDEALKAGVDVLWVGARSTVNPFYVQEIADALDGVNIPVLVKNPIHPELSLWMGALERLNKKGITKLVAVHRGFYAFERKPYRNDPRWEIPIELKLHCPELPLICDPSHIAGKRDLLQQVCQKAIDLDMDGLMIETHINPAAALSDAEQQLTPQELSELYASLTLRKSTVANAEFENHLEELRNIIDGIDEELLKVLAKRMNIVERIGEYKRDNNVTILQLERWLQILRSRKATGSVLGLTDDFVKALYELIHHESIQRQTDIMNDAVEKKP